MSTGMSDATLAALRVRDRGFLAPSFNHDITSLLEIMEGKGHDPVIFETLRLPQVQAEYFRRKTSKQRDVRRSSHGHGVAVDIISIARGWDFTDEWKEDLEEACKRLGLTCGGLWKSPVDWPHVQVGEIPGAVPDALVAAYNRDGLLGSWTHLKLL